MLPTTVVIKKECLADWDKLSELEKEELLNDTLANDYGFLNRGFSYEETEDAVILDDVAWEVDEEDE